MVALMSMLIISFGLWGIGDMLKLGGQSNEVAHVGGTHIPLYGWFGGVSVPVEEVKDRFNRQLQQIQQQTGQRPEPDGSIEPPRILAPRPGRIHRGLPAAIRERISSVQG